MNKRIISRGRHRQAAWEFFRKGRRWCQYFAESCHPSLIHVGGASYFSELVECLPIAEAYGDDTNIVPKFSNQENNAGVQWTKLIPGLILEFCSMSLLWLCSRDAALQENN